ncbi:response regulator transcription factor [Brevibacillus centrosporus]|uniref:DNA-binding response regulator, OmpR family, contains REC and winged-helix (WHTH) domain n=1 Tax=Brevibacillus centrosporus TaxID=54910 RepID=A0A1I3XSB4_9BACL|nr:response regulator transcription factor [Brevibacillus centrosporus]MEC2128790.1 response regulator transcription factor [Brevibacillus centrosporus]RNB71347.1 DNA-binding response regulator [Brevibacillus centrosporus]GED30541.1 DNA-binding response regulator [Brevibacillus centrosporus]SFK22547.1 DNA-binding response regulator, OmpR family, contains REC and winged-helix (wHTH) domain [Brevibacillus centrosporus]
MHILLVEDDPKLGPLIQYKLSQDYHTVEWVADAELAMEYLRQTHYDLYILDWMMPKKSGLVLCEEIRASHDWTPILMLTARDAIDDRVTGLTRGADDYLVKPFAFEELFARIHALSRRIPVAQNQEQSCEYAGIRLYRQSHEVWRDEKLLNLTKKEFQLLEFFLRHPEKVLTREQIINYVWGLDAMITPNAVDAAIKLLRKKVDDGFAQKLIHNVRGVGYRLYEAEEHERV